MFISLSLKYLEVEQKYFLSEVKEGIERELGSRSEQRGGRGRGGLDYDSCLSIIYNQIHPNVFKKWIAISGKRLALCTL